MFGNKLKSLRKNLGITQDEIAKSLGLSRGAYSHFENGRNEPDYETLNKIAAYFQVSIDYLLDRTDDPTPLQKITKVLKAPQKGYLNLDGLFNKNDDDWNTFLAQLPEDQAMLYQNEDYPDDQKITIMEEAEKIKQKKMKKIQRLLQYSDEVIDDALIYAAFDAEQRKKMNDEN